MKNLTALLLCFVLLCTTGISIFAAGSGDNETEIKVTVPETHTVTVTAEGAYVYYEGEKGESFSVPRLSSPKLQIKAKSGRAVETVTLDGVDVTDKLKNGYLTLDPIYEDKAIVVTTKIKPVSPTPDTPTDPEEPNPSDPDDPDDPDNPDVPSTESYLLTVIADGAKVFRNGKEGHSFEVYEADEPRLLIRAESGKQIESIVLDGVDLTAELDGGYLTLEPVFGDKVLTVTTKSETAKAENTYTVSGRITLNGQPLANVEIELRSTLKTATTDAGGYFSFDGVEAGKHSLTAVSNETVIGYLSFDLREDNESDVALQDGGIYTVSIDKNGAGVELDLVLNEDLGIIVPTQAKSITQNLWLWIIIILALVVIATVAYVWYRKKKKAKIDEAKEPNQKEN